MSQKRTRSPSPEPASSEIAFSEPIKDRSSTFIAAFSSQISASALQALPQFASASHRIAGWRLASRQKTLTQDRYVYTTGHDDNGEAHAGRKLENLLQNQAVVGSVVVARWYGGVMLGPVRFTHIEDCAKDAIAKRAEEVQTSEKRRKTEADEKLRKETLVKTLKQRDESIMALRGLLAEKQGKEPTGQNVTKPPIYLEITLTVLEKLEKARDKSIEWLLKELDNADDASKQMQASKAVKAPSTMSSGSTTHETSSISAEKESSSDQRQPEVKDAGE